MLTGIQWQSGSALRTRQILSVDQRHLTAIGQSPKATAQRVAILGEAGVDLGQGLIKETHRRAGVVGDEDRQQSAHLAAFAMQVQCQ